LQIDKRRKFVYTFAIREASNMASKARFLLYPILIILSSFLLSCSTPIFKNSKTIHVMVLKNPDNPAYYVELANLFKNQFPQYEIQWDQAETIQQYTNLLRKRIRANEWPDLLFVPNYRDFIRKNLLLEISGRMTEDPKFNWKVLMPNTRSLVDFQGKVYGIPVEMDAQVLYVNLEKLKRANLYAPYDGWDWVSFLRYAKALNKPSKKDPALSEHAIIIRPMLRDVLPFLQSTGLEFITRYRDTSFDQPGFHSFFTQLRNLGLQDESLDASPSQDTLLEMFLSGKTAFLLAGKSSYPIIQEKMSQDWNILPLPVLSKPASMIEGKIFGISKKARNKEGAWDLLSFLCAGDGASFALRQKNFIPVSRALVSSSLFLEEESGKRIDLFLRSMENGFPDPFSNYTNRQKMESLIDSALREIFTPGTDIPSICLKLDAEAQKLMN
jgi:ABC-type glycerol-3-phosphate transport system substrate-binding protein